MLNVTLTMITLSALGSRCRLTIRHWVDLAIRAAEYVPKQTGTGVRQQHFLRSGGRRTAMVPSFTRRVLYLCADELSHTSPLRLRAQGDGVQLVPGVESVFH